VPLERVPLFVREGAIIPLEVEDGTTGHGGAGSAGHLTLWVYPGRESERTYYPDHQQAVQLRGERKGGRTTVEIGAQRERYVLRIKEPSLPQRLQLERGEMTGELSRLGEWKTFDRASEGWYYDERRNYLWVRFETEETGAKLKVE
jgi:alpha-D-xyloside xylohydrolase